MATCPKCGHEGFWMENMKSGSYFACFSLNCNWRSQTPPNNPVSNAVNEMAQRNGPSNGVAL